MISDMYDWLARNWSYLAPLVAVVVAWWLNTHLPGKVKLRYGRANNSFHRLSQANGEQTAVYCEKLYVQNSGIRAANNVEVSFSNEPTAMSTYPPLKYRTEKNLNQKFILTIESIAPKELVVIDTIHINSPTAEIVSVRSIETTGRAVNFWVTRRFSRSTNVLLLTTFFLGIYSIFYVLVFLTARIVGV